MRDAILRFRLARRAWMLAALGLLLPVAGCELSGQSEPELSGPSDQAFNVEFLAQPDVVNADGVSTSHVRLVLRDQNGQPVSGYAVLFDWSGDGTLAPHPSSTYVGPVQAGEVMATDRNGVAVMIYTASTTVGLDVTVAARPYGFDAANLFFRSVIIHQR